MSHMAPEIVSEAFVMAINGTDGYWIPVSCVTDERIDASSRTEGKYFARFSAPGYLDTTDWVGPYDTEEEARDDLASMHDVCPGCWEACWDSDSPCVQVCSACEEEHEPNEGSKYACPVMGPGGYVPAPMGWKRPEDCD